MAVVQGLGKGQVDLAIRARDRQRTNALDHIEGRQNNLFSTELLNGAVARTTTLSVCIANSADHRAN